MGSDTPAGFAEPERPVSYETIEGLAQTDLRSLVRRHAELGNQAKIVKEERDKLSEQIETLLDAFEAPKSTDVDGYSVVRVADGAPKREVDLQKLIMICKITKEQQLRAIVEKPGRKGYVLVTAPKTPEVV
jgi:hypothetical protein